MTALQHGLSGLAVLTVGLAVGRYAAPGQDKSTVAPGRSPPQASVADRVFFGRAIPGGGSVSEESWVAFLHEVVTPRFPEGLTVWRAEGQWADPRGQLVRESVMVVEVLHLAGSRADSSLTAIAREYRRRFHQGAVLRVTTPALGLLYE